MTPDKNLIFDIGMHIGQDTEFYLKKGFRVIAVEANPALVKKANSKFKSEVKDGQLVIENVALGHERGKTTFYVNKKVSEWSSVHEHLGARQVGAKKITVEMARYVDLAEKYGTPYYLKIDIEGADLIPIMGIMRTPQKPAYVSYEAASVEGASLLYAAGYKQFKFVLQRPLTELKLPKPSLEGKDVDHDFILGSTGPFGEETPGNWCNLEQCLTDYYVYKHFRRLDTRLEQDWADIHARSERYLEAFK
jgi:FkbM family methyltransferase